MTPEVAVISPRGLEYLISIAEKLNFRLAAEDCAVSQPALSAQVKKIEEALDVQIFERTKRGIIVTQIGEQIVAQARIVLEELETIGSIARGAERPLEGTFNLGVIPTLLPYSMPKLIGPLSRIFPKLELCLREAPEVELFEALRVGKLDALIATDLDSNINRGFTSVSLFREPILLTISSKSRLAKRKYVKPTSIKIEEMILLNPPNSLTSLAEVFTSAEHEAAQEGPVYTDTLESICCMVANSHKYSLLPLLASSHRRELRTIKHLRISGQSLHREVKLFWRPRYKSAHAIRQFGLATSKILLRQQPGLLSASR